MEKVQENNNGSKRKTGITVLVIMLIAAFIAGILWWWKLSTTVSTDNAKVTGDIVDLSFKVSGRLDAIKVKEGDKVEKGQIIAVLDNTQYAVNMNQAEAALEIAKANLAKYSYDLESLQAAKDRAEQSLIAAQAQAKKDKIALDDAKRQLEQTQALYQEGAVSKESYDTVLSKYLTLASVLEASSANVKAQQAALADAEAKLAAYKSQGLAALEAQVKQSQAAYDNARLTYENTVITSPVAGTVLRVAVQVGENVTAGQTVVTVADLNQTWVTANIEEKKIARIKPGQKVEVKIDAYPGSVFKGKVIEVGGAAQSVFALIPTENTSGNYTKVVQRIPIKIEVAKNKDFVLKPGMSAVVKIFTK